MCRHYLQNENYGTRGRDSLFDPDIFLITPPRSPEELRRRWVAGQTSVGGEHRCMPVREQYAASECRVRVDVACAFELSVFESRRFG
jgi:hypothetical protein